MSRVLVTAALSRAVHDRAFLALLQRDATAAVMAMEMPYEMDDIRALDAISGEITHMDDEEAMTLIRAVLQQPQGVFGSPQREE